MYIIMYIIYNIYMQYKRIIYMYIYTQHMYSIYVYCIAFKCTTSLLVMCNTYRYIEISILPFNIVIRYLLLGVSIHLFCQFSIPRAKNMLNFIPQNNKLVCMTLVYHFLTSTTTRTIIIIIYIKNLM